MPPRPRAAPPRARCGSRVRRRSPARRRRAGTSPGSTWSVGLENEPERVGKRAPRLALHLELFDALGRERVEPCPPVVLRHAPLGRDVALALEAPERGIERAVVHVQRAL